MGEWKCGDSFFTKCSSCSVDRAAHDPASLNPLHPSITPIGLEGPATTETHDLTPSARKGSEYRITNNTTPSKPKPRPAVPVVDLLSPGHPQTNPVGNGSTGVVYPRDVKTGEAIMVALSEIGKASRFGDKTLGGTGKCRVFEVVLQQNEPTMCPACIRSPKRARLPAHARGCFGLS
ncbi:uncharacterized protein BDR25DRAFT_339512 [Lindgomyces ingoldianus]|uniref:Uncharacterized protein n=1 Tax=Lindgomyces ingoldianus TaxID=673940 RepID=A0ACB6RBA8_9PLEO|nr:uncharacterized protein BDR25DRAFT_339512 [Lindgomyces ingoldianus]KAF2476529.1 hypothetical protein BDR25DRAFT_339512 [Lindgomyces ingoldianus]